MKTYLLIFPLALAGCSTTQTGPVVVQVSEPTTSANRFRTVERQRDLWISPRVIDNEIIQHEQVITFVEKPIAWQLGTTLEPNAVNEPTLPQQVGDYNDTVIARHKEMLNQARSEVAGLEKQVADLKKSSSDVLTTKDQEIQVLNARLSQAQDQISSISQKLDEINQSKEQSKPIVQPKKSWWMVWK